MQAPKVSLAKANQHPPWDTNREYTALTNASEALWFKNKHPAEQLSFSRGYSTDTGHVCHWQHLLGPPEQLQPDN